MNRWPKEEHASEPENGDREFDKRVARRDRDAALAATPAKQREANEGNVVVPRECAPAAAAMGSRTNDGFVKWQPRDAYSEKAAKKQTEYECDDGESHGSSKAATPPAGKLLHCWND